MMPKKETTIKEKRNERALRIRFYETVPVVTIFGAAYILLRVISEQHKR